MPEHDNLPQAQRDTFEVPGRPLLIGGLLLAGFVTGMLGLARWIYPASVGPIPLEEPRFPQPRLQAAPNLDYARFHQQQLHELETAAWTDGSHRAVRVPIDEAMRKLAQDGIPDWPTAPRRQ